MNAIKKVKTEKKVGMVERDDIFDTVAQSIDYELFANVLSEMVDKKILRKAPESEHYDLAI